jgi:hypothetical protein
MPVIIDPALYMKKKGDLFWIPQKRELPTAFKLFGGMYAFMLCCFRCKSVLNCSSGSGCIVYTTPSLN